MSKRAQKWTLFLLSVLSGVAALVQTWDIAIKQSPKVHAFLDQFPCKYSLPQPTRDFLFTLESLRSAAGRGDKFHAEVLGSLKETFASGNPITVTDEAGRNLSDLGLQVFEPDKPMQPLLAYQFLRVFRIVNTGSGTARDIVLTTPFKGYYEIWEEGSRVVPVEKRVTEGDVRIPDVAPGGCKFVYYWSELDETYLSAFKIAYDGGRVPIQSGSALRTGSNYVWDLERSHASSALLLVGVCSASLFAARHIKDRSHSRERQSSAATREKAIEVSSQAGEKGA